MTSINLEYEPDPWGSLRELRGQYGVVWDNEAYYVAGRARACWYFCYALPVFKRIPDFPQKHLVTREYDFGPRLSGILVDDPMKRSVYLKAIEAECVERLKYPLLELPEGMERQEIVIADLDTWRLQFSGSVRTVDKFDALRDLTESLQHLLSRIS